MGSKNSVPELRDEDVTALCEASGLGEEEVGGGTEVGDVAGGGGGWGNGSRRCSRSSDIGGEQNECSCFFSRSGSSLPTSSPNIQMGR